MKKNVFKTQELTRFLEVIGMSGDCEIKECVLDFGEKALKIIAITAQESVAVKGNYQIKDVENYEPLGKLGLDNLADIRKYLNSFSEETISITKQGNYLVLKGKKKRIKIQLRDNEYIPVVDGGKVDKLISLGQDNLFTLEKEILEKIVENSKLLGADEINLVGDKGAINYKAKSWAANEIDEKFATEQKLNSFNVSFKKNFGEAIGNVKDNLVMGINPKAPVYVLYQENAIKIEWTVCPVLKTEE